MEQSIPHVERTGVAVEPLLTTQWFLNSAALAPAATQAVMDGSSSMGSEGTVITPASYSSMFFDWMRGIQPWFVVTYSRSADLCMSFNSSANFH
jgi:valyl-tRNA synthetase